MCIRDSYDAVWPASSLWLTAGDTQYRVKHAQSISITPVVFGIRQGLAEELGFVGTEVSVSDLLSAIQSGKLNFCMTSATPVSYTHLDVYKRQAVAAGDPLRGGPADSLTIGGRRIHVGEDVYKRQLRARLSDGRTTFGK